MALGVLGQSRAQQASSLAYFDCLLLFGRGRLDIGIFHPAHASFGSGEGSPHWWGVAGSRSSQPVTHDGRDRLRRWSVAHAQETQP